ncbi:lambda family phage portal protein [Kushneria sinocarnis]|uniref:Lambda family phage portal protein n=1 Tax=Kushneria sinocarnis TaxID=595502 RepID=A0A420WVM3_9GAMM|nr:phage portal protein [Kushneria sinocarnis]RKR02599.1 lambda family phage portal protein [Kushneria sinocarnis]
MFDFLKRQRRETGQVATQSTESVEPTIGDASGNDPGRMAARISRAQKRSLLAQAQSDRLSSDMPTMPVPTDDFISRNQRSLVARSRHLLLTNDYARGFLRQARQNIVGHQGIGLQAQARDRDGSLDDAANDAIEADWRRWSGREHCDISGRRSLRQLCNRAVEDAAANGEFMFRVVIGRNVNAWGIALQVLDPQRCPVDYSVDRLSGGRFIRHGIEYNRNGRAIHYLFSTLDPSESDYTVGGRHFVKVPASEMLHGFLEDLVGQRRGLPWMVTAVMRMRHLDGFEQSALVNARIGAAKGGFFEWDEGRAPDRDDEADEEPLYLDAEPGSFQELPEGLRFKGWEPQFPNGELAPFSKQMLRGIATGLGVSYNTLANDLEHVSFSSIRQGTLNEREHWKDLQEWLIESLMDPLFDLWLPRALLKGIPLPLRPGATLRPDRLEKYRERVWQPRRWDWVDPDKDSKTAERDMRNKVRSPSQVIRERGGDPRSVWRQYAADRQAMLDAGIPEHIVDAEMGSSHQSRPSQPSQSESEESGNEG